MASRILTADGVFPLYDFLTSQEGVVTAKYLAMRKSYIPTTMFVARRFPPT
jgi:hypothetical protein